MPLSIKGYLETSFSDWDGLVSAVVFLPGCNWRCYFCHNHSLVFEPEIYPDIPPQTVLDSLRKHRKWIDGLCVGGGEPTLSPGLLPFLREVKDSGFKVKLDTNASQPRVIEELIGLGLVDYLAIDIKAPLTDKAYSAICRKQIKVGAICESLSIIKKAYREKRVDYELRTTLAPPYFSGEAIVSICEKISGAPRYVLQQFDPHNLREEENKKERQPYQRDEIEAWARRAREYIGNVSIREV